jgi:hypothetical protein
VDRRHLAVGLLWHSERFSEDEASRIRRRATELGGRLFALRRGFAMQLAVAGDGHPGRVGDVAAAALLADNARLRGAWAMAARLPDGAWWTVCATRGQVYPATVDQPGGDAVFADADAARAHLLALARLSGAATIYAPKEFGAPRAVEPDALEELLVFGRDDPRLQPVRGLRLRPAAAAAAVVLAGLAAAWLSWPSAGPDPGAGIVLQRLDEFGRPLSGAPSAGAASSPGPAEGAAPPVAASPPPSAPGLPGPAGGEAGPAPPAAPAPQRVVAVGVPAEPPGATEAVAAIRDRAASAVAGIGEAVRAAVGPAPSASGAAAAAPLGALASAVLARCLGELDAAVEGGARADATCAAAAADVRAAPAAEQPAVLVRVLADAAARIGVDLAPAPDPGAWRFETPLPPAAWSWLLEAPFVSVAAVTVEVGVPPVWRVRGSVLGDAQRPAGAAKLDTEQRPAGAAKLDTEQRPAGAAKLDTEQRPAGAAELDTEQRPAGAAKLDTEQRPSGAGAPEPVASEDPR